MCHEKTNLYKNTNTTLFHNRREEDQQTEDNYYKRKEKFDSSRARAVSFPRVNRKTDSSQCKRRKLEEKRGRKAKRRDANCMLPPCLTFVRLFWCDVSSVASVTDRYKIIS